MLFRVDGTRQREISMRWMRAVVAAAWVAGLCGCGPSMSTLDALAQRGRLDRNAPVSVQLETSMAAPPAKVWTLLVNAAKWPGWHGAVTAVQVDGVLAQGTRFQWKTRGTTVQSQVQLCVPGKRLAWTGRAYTAKAIHVWELLPTPSGQTVVIVRESMDGLLMARMVSRQQLLDADTEWLSDLKRAAEQ
ncbi:SRPBCC family protein [Acidipila sp. EB88]|uniref:SRPBCC family protein n=1 Tax=Acidipila sp. EB88 TaxID=2305226 RepID=UPI000F5FC8E0|nr:SRPBCC family protein [Acidipila sp. EB88]RRA47940.1 hypothetical protein D1Y84_06195 [Acidipila sp. EB88]